MLYMRSAAWRHAYKSNAASACNSKSSSLCASAGASEADMVALRMATSPQQFDARRSSDMGGFNAIGSLKVRGGGGDEVVSLGHRPGYHMHAYSREPFSNCWFVLWPCFLPGDAAVPPKLDNPHFP
jgi:hypothetical protein